MTLAMLRIVNSVGVLSAGALIVKSASALTLFALLGAGSLGLNMLAPVPAMAQARVTVEPVDRVIAVVNTEVITERELAAQIAQVSKRAREQGSRLPPPDELQERVLERIVLDKAVLQAAKERGITINEAQVDRAIGTIAQDNNISVRGLRDQLLAQGMTFDAFREEIRAQIVEARLREQEVDARMKVSDADIDAWLAEQAGKQQQSARLEVAQILLRMPENPTQEQMAEAKASAEKIQLQAKSGMPFDQLAQQYSDAPTASSDGGSMGMRTVEQLPRVFADAVMPLSVGEVAPIVRSGAGLHVLKLINREGGGDDASKPIQQTKVRHILIRPGPAIGEAEILQRLTSIRERLIAGQVEFAAMARQYSADGSAAAGGDLGWVYAGDTVPEFERSMDALQPGDLSEPVRTQFGYHLIEVIDRRQDSASPERERQVARQALMRERSEIAWQDWLSELRSRTYVDMRFEQ